MLVIGLTGPSGAGKSTVAERLAAYGLPIINADEVYHQLLIPPSKCLNELVDSFGTSILSPNGTLNRRALGEIVFSHPAALDRLNAIAHKHVMEEIRNQLELLRRKNTRAAVLDAPQLFEAGANRDCSVIISVLADTKLRLERIVERDGLDADTAYRRIAAQKKDEFFRSHSDYIIENNGSAEALYPQIHRILLETGVLTP
ncbi:MAG: dephospho-CoA kinase [Clostridia bacterium]|nr:dephospho-CoA kinase [Clostridia bacterium]